MSQETWSQWFARQAGDVRALVEGAVADWMPFTQSRTKDQIQADTTKALDDLERVHAEVRAVEEWNAKTGALSDTGAAALASIRRDYELLVGPVLAQSEEAGGQKGMGGLPVIAWVAITGVSIAITSVSAAWVYSSADARAELVAKLAWYREQLERCEAMARDGVQIPDGLCKPLDMRPQPLVSASGAGIGIVVAGALLLGALALAGRSS